MMEYEPDVEKKKTLILFLLNNGLNSYKKYINPITNFNNNEIDNLFEGKKDFEYTGINSKEIFFQKLLDKFNNFSFLLDNWYLDSEKRCYIKELWQKNQCLEALRDLNHEEIKQKLPFINNWSEEIQNEFFNIINDYIKETRVYLMKNNLIREEEDINEIINLLRDIKNFFENEQISDEYRNRLRSNYQGIEDIVISSLAPLVYIIKDDIKQGLEERLKNKAKNIFFSILNNPEKKVEVIDFQRLSHIAERFTKSKVAPIAHLLLNFANLGYSCYTFYQTLQKVKEIEEYKDRLKRIKELFIIHCDIGINDDSINSATQKINEAKIRIEQDYDDLLKLICEIEESINFLKKQKIRSVVSLGVSLFSGIFGFGSYLIKGFSSFSLLNTALNVGSGVANATNLIHVEKGIDELKKILIEANEQKQIMKEKLDQLENDAKELKTFIEQSKVNY